MLKYAALAYVVVEIAAFWAMTHFLGFGWALLITLGAAVVGYAVLGRRARGLLGDLRRASRQEIGPGAPLTDSALFAGAAILTILPGVVSTVVGLALTTRPVRGVLRPAVAAAAARKATLVIGTVPAGFPGATFPGGEFADGRYVDGTVEGDVTDATSDVVDVTRRGPDGRVYVEVPQLPEPPTARP